MGVNRPVRLADNLLGKLQRRRLSGTGPKMPDLGPQALDDDIGCHAAGHLAGPMSTDAIGNQGNAVVAVHGNGILVESPHSSGIGHADQFKVMSFVFQDQEKLAKVTSIVEYSTL
jgi:hypothetical protein